MAKRYVDSAALVAKLLDELDAEAMSIPPPPKVRQLPTYPNFANVQDTDFKGLRSPGPYALPEAEEGIQRRLRLRGKWRQRNLLRRVYRQQEKG